MTSIRNNNNWNYHKTDNYRSTITLSIISVAVDPPVTVGIEPPR